MSDDAPAIPAPRDDEAAVERSVALALVRVTERAAMAAARLRGRGDEMAADTAASRAMHEELGRLPIRGRVAIGAAAGEEHILFVDEGVGAGEGPSIDLAVAPLEGATLCAKDMPGAISIVAMARRGSLLGVPDVYMDKIAIGPGFPPGLVDLDREPAANIAALAEARRVAPGDITVCILDRPRHAELIAKCRQAGARVRLISDGDVAGVVFAAQPRHTGIDMYLGRGGAPEGVLAAVALRCVGGQMQGRLAPKGTLDTAVFDRRKKFSLDELAGGDVVVCATGVTDGPLLAGVKFRRRAIVTETVVCHSSTGTVRRIRAEHRVESD